MAQGAASGPENPLVGRDVLHRGGDVPHGGAGCGLLSDDLDRLDAEAPQVSKGLGQPDDRNVASPHRRVLERLGLDDQGRRVIHGVQQEPVPEPVFVGGDGPDRPAHVPSAVAVGQEVGRPLVDARIDECPCAVGAHLETGDPRETSHVVQEKRIGKFWERHSDPGKLRRFRRGRGFLRRIERTTRCDKQEGPSEQPDPSKATGRRRHWHVHGTQGSDFLPARTADGQDSRFTVRHSGREGKKNPSDVASALSEGVCLPSVGLTGLEPVTSALSGQRSNRLSYRPVHRV